MIVPANNAFIGDGNPSEFELSDVTGNFNGPLTIDVFGADICDSGTEVNDGQSAPFSPVGGTSTEGGVVGLHLGWVISSVTRLHNVGSTPRAYDAIFRITVTRVRESASAGCWNTGIAVESGSSSPQANLTV